MSCALQLSLPTYAFDYSRTSKRNRTRHLQILCSCTQSNNLPEERKQKDIDNERVEGLQPVILVERYGNGSAKRYMLDDEWQVQTFITEHGSKDDRFRGSNFSNVTLSWLPDIVKDFVFPAGFPASVSDDYLQYMLLQFPTNVTAWICHTIVTSSLLKAVGVGSFSGTTAAASAAAVRWVSKDGIGALGRLFIGLAILKLLEG